MKYQPPYTITPKIISLVADISQEIGKITATSQIERDLRLRKINQVKTIRGTLAIEGNTLDESHITAILEGKRILAPQKEILEIRNAIKTYDKFQNLNYKEEKDLLCTHLTLMQGLVDEVGVYRSGSVGVMEGNNVIHLAPPAKKLRELMKNLFDWIANTEEHPIISSCVFHYEFEFIHPFADGNGRMGRLWQSLILSQWNKLFSYIPVESIVYEHQKAYYEAIQESTNKTDCYPFIEFMLEMLSIAIREINPQVEQQVSPQVKKLIEVLKDKELTRQELQNKLKLKDRKSFVERYLKPALEQKLIEMTIPEKPNSKSQKYRMARP
ncbi:Fic family protein [Francisella frigiditurris]|uniref:Fic/DOC family protein n=1 Tax=Francisella frigiditurris TaxID=1542390 RepID=A0A1J0KS60_9GAMM|nr:Fic family protein [Francisella frigiditurris]APC96543.1 fic/DOC family protein [Francisella frigiditurris]